MLEYTHGGDVLTAQAAWGGGVVDCSANLNPLGMPPAVAQAAQAAAGTSAAYPDPLCRALTAAIARADGVQPAQVLCGAGAAELIFRLVFALRPRRALVTAPTFSEYEGALACIGCPVEHYVLGEARDFAVDEAILQAITPETDLVFLCTPNNPTGQLVEQGLLLAAARRCREVGACLAVDECFLPLSAGGAGLAPWLEEYPNLVLLRAFTKSYAMAGLRLGYALTASETLLEAMARCGQPWSVSTPAQAAGVTALTQCPHWPAEGRALVEAQRPLLRDGLKGLGCRVVPSRANYLLFRLAGVTDLKERLLGRGVLIRACGNYHGLGPDWYRVCVGDGEKNRRLLAAMEEVV